ncbi:MAG: AGE family epimerase/isomerase [Rhizobiaceae bacterium]
MSARDSAQLATNSLCAYIMCGGGGTRLWPLSRQDNPKQNLQLSGPHTMLGATTRRVAELDLTDVSVSINFMGGQQQHANMEAVRQDSPGTFCSMVLEPFGRNTGAAVAIACLDAMDEADGDPLLLILPSDHVIRPVERFSAAITSGLDAANSGQIVVFGIEPTSPATGYGYIEAAQKADVSRVKSFREKPTLETAYQYLQSGQHLWNAGIFLFRASTMLEALQQYAPEILQTSKEAVQASKKKNGITWLDPETFKTVPSNSIDYAVMEHATNVTVVRAIFDWHDVGSFNSLKELNEADESRNCTHGDIILHECSNNLFHSEGPLISAIGVNDLAVVATPDATLIAPLERSEEIRTIVSSLESNNHLESQFTPWISHAAGPHLPLVSKMQDWLFGQALPFWTHKGMDQNHGGFHEVVDFQGNSTGADKRLRTMARQIYTFAKASEMGWQGDTTAAIQLGLDFLTNSPVAPQGGWHKTFDAQSRVLDHNEDVYDHAFVLLALSQAEKVGTKLPSGLMDRAKMAIEAQICTLPGGEFCGYFEDSARKLPRRSNPHMHLLEAFMACYEATGGSACLEQATAIVNLFKSRFYDRKSLMLGEYFDAELYFGPTGPDLFEPGHHFEWTHLLIKHAQLTGTAKIDEINGLFNTAKALGTDPVTGLAYGVVDAVGKPTNMKSRCWMQTEYLTCVSTLAANGRPHLSDEANRCAQRIWKYFLQPAPTGMWIDVVDPRGRPATQTVPASTFYHLINGIDAYVQLSAEQA